MSTSLYELTSEMLEIEQILSNFDGDISDEDKEAAINQLFARWQENGDELKTKIDNYLWLIDELNGRSKQRYKKADEIKELADNDYKSSKRLTQSLLVFMKAIKKDKFDSNYHKLGVVKNGGLRPIFYNFEKIEEVPADYIVEKTTKDIDKDKVREELEAGGTLGFAELKERGERLSIK